jgi:hypothetical protein
MCIISKNHNVNLHLYGILQDNLQFSLGCRVHLLCVVVVVVASIDPAS